MKTRPAQFWMFHIGFWLVAGFLLFLSGLSQTTFEIALVRNVYLMIAGFIACFLLVFVFERLAEKPVFLRLFAGLILSYILGTLITVAINPVTFSQQGIPLEELGFRRIFAGTLNFALVFSVWTIIFLLIGEAGRGKFSQKGLKEIACEKGNMTVFIKVEDISYIKASGDYVEIFSGGETYLKRGTMTSLQENLGEGGFFRIHRSILVNQAKVKGLEGKSKGEYTIVLEDSTRVKSSRGYAKAILEAFPALK